MSTTCSTRSIPNSGTIIVKAFMAMESERTFRGPLPAPEDFKAYGEMIPNAPERILSMTEQQVLPPHTYRGKHREKRASGKPSWPVDGLFYCLDPHRNLHVIGILWTRLGCRSDDDSSHWLVRNLCVTAEST